MTQFEQQLDILRRAISSRGFEACQAFDMERKPKKNCLLREKSNESPHMHP